MRSILKALLLVCLLVTVSPTLLFSQTVEQSAKLQELSIELREKFEQERSHALKMADSLGIPDRKKFDDGRSIVLVKFENGRPVYKTTYNANGASILNTDLAQSNSPTGFGLSGTGQVIGLWDNGMPLQTHNALAGRVFVKEQDDLIFIDGHATHVAGTLIGNDSNKPLAKGMAPAASVDGYVFLNDLAEMTSAASNGLLNSVHPYGYRVGWFEEDGNNAGWYWSGDKSWAEDNNFGFYDDDNARAWDEVAYNAPNYLIVASAGNDRGYGPESGDGKDIYEYDGDIWQLCDNPESPYECNAHEIHGGNNGYDTLADQSVAKNILVVGAVDSTALGPGSDGGMWSKGNWGPTDDGRIKPDIVAKGVSVLSSNGDSDSAYGNRTGTSHSAPMIAGSAALLLEHQENLHPGKRLLSSTLRGLISHTATDLGRPGPDYEYGWGLMNTQKAAEVMQDNSDNNRIHIRELTIKDGQTLQFTIKAKGNNEPLRTTIAWTDLPGVPVDPIDTGEGYSLIPNDPTDLMLVNDLDMRLTDPNNTSSYPYTLDPANPDLAAVANTDNFRDNIEQIYIENPTTDDLYTVTISHKDNLSNGKQAFSLIITGNASIDYQQPIAEGSGEGWRFISSPIETATYGELLSNFWTQGPLNSDDESAASSNSNVMQFDGSNYVMPTDLSTTIPSGSGTAVFVFDGDKNKNLSVNGLENIGDVVVEDLLHPKNDESDVYTLLGNPFNSTIDFDLFSNQSQVGNVVYVYDHDFEPSSFDAPDTAGDPSLITDAGGGFRAWSTAGSGSGSLANGLIAPFQGFFVYSTGSSPTLTIPESAKTTGGTFYKEQPNQNPVMQIAARINGSYTGDTWLSFSETGSIKKNSYDAPYLYPLDYKPFLSLQTRFDGTGYNIKNLPAVPETAIDIPLVAEAWEPDQNEQAPGYRPLPGNMELIWPKMENIPADWAVTLTDHHLGKIINMKTQRRYEYTTSPQKQVETTMPYKMELLKAVNKQSENTRFTITVSPNGQSQIADSNLPESFELHQNYPNPFNPTTVIRYELPETAEVTLDVYSISGQRVTTLVNQNQQAGSYTVPFNANRLASGIYIYQLKAGNFLSTQKMVLLK